MSFVVAFAEKSIVPFPPSPLIEPDVTISVIRLSDGFHMEAVEDSMVSSLEV
jgi:hypothetical protein